MISGATVHVGRHEAARSRHSVREFRVPDADNRIVPLRGAIVRRTWGGWSPREQRSTHAAPKLSRARRRLHAKPLDMEAESDVPPEWSKISLISSGRPVIMPRGTAHDTLIHIKYG